MKAVIYTRYGSPDVLRLAEIPTPSPRPGEVLVKVVAVSLNRSDWELLHGSPLYARIGGLFRPRRHILGSDIAGRVESVGPGVTRFQPGDAVFADILDHMGGFAEYVRVPERLLAPLPAGLSLEQAACLPQAGAIALQATRGKGNVQPGQRVLVNGAGGGTGMFAVQLARIAGAEVTAVDNAEKLDYLRLLGADHVLDYTRVDFTRQGATYDLILDVSAHHSPGAYRRALAPGGRYFYVGGSMAALAGVLLLGPLLGRADDRRVRLLAVRLGVHGLDPLIELCRAGAVTTHVDRRFALSEVPQALRYLGEGHAKGKAVIVLE